MPQQPQQPERRRRRPQPVPPELQESEPNRIVIAEDGDTPEWLVSAGNVSGAASRRAKQFGTDKAEQESKRTQRREKAPRDQNEARQSAQGRPAQQEATRHQATGDASVSQTVAEKGAARKAAPARSAAAPRKASASQRSAQSRARSASSSKRKKKKKKKRGTGAGSLLIRLLLAAAAVALCVVGAMGGARLMDIKQTLDRGDGVFYPNIFVNNIPLEGKTLDEAAQAVTAQVTSLISNWKITLRTQDGRSWDITGDDLRMQYDVADQLDQLWAIGHTGSSQTRYEQVRALENEPVYRYTTLSYDMSMVNQILTQIKSEVDRAPVSATKVYDESVWPPYTYTDDTPGQALDITGLNEKICDLVNRLESGVVDLAPTVVEPAVTRAYLESQIVKLATYETTLGKTGDYVEARQENIRIGTEKFNHLTIKAGEQVSFNKVTGKRSDPKNGYQEALEIAYGQYRPGRGGGICQVSSTLYNAVVNAGLEIVKRVPHAIPSSYVPKGQDATVSDDRYDFIFKNNTGEEIFIESSFYKAKNGYYRTSFTIYGRPDPNGYSYKLESVVTQTIGLPEPEYSQDKDGTYVIYDDETYQYSEGREGYVVDVYLVTMDSKGLEVSRTLDHTDSYAASAPKYYVGVTPRETPVPTTGLD